MRILFFDCFSGASGDMILAAFLDLGFPMDELVSLPDRLGLGNVKISCNNTKRSGIGALSVTIGDGSSSVFRGLSQIKTLLKGADIAEEIKDRAFTVFQELAKAESRVHGCLPDEVHFHEVGAVDTLIDVVGSLSALQFFDPDRVVVSPLPLSRGFVQSDHGVLPLPAPAVVELLRGKPVEFVSVEQELVTPTGAALLVNMADEWGMPTGDFAISRIGYGSGKRDNPERPNLLRLFLGELEFDISSAQEKVLEIRTVIDDMTSEHIGFLYELLLKEGAIDFWTVPVVMKKNRPGFELICLCRQEDGQRLMELIFSHTSTLGVRIFRPSRKILRRSKMTVLTRWGRVKAKLVQRPNGKEVVPEFEACREISQKYKIPLKKIYSEVTVKGEAQLLDDESQE